MQTAANSYRVTPVNAFSSLASGTNKYSLFRIFIANSVTILNHVFLTLCSNSCHSSWHMALLCTTVLVLNLLNAIVIIIEIYTIIADILFI